MISPIELINSLIKDDGLADLFEERVDVAIRVGALDDSTMIARSLSPFLATRVRVTRLSCGEPQTSD
jgi:hypothetical protein